MRPLERLLHHVFGFAGAAELWYAMATSRSHSLPYRFEEDILRYRNPSAKPERQLGYRGVQPSSRLIFSLEIPQACVIMCTGA